MGMMGLPSGRAWACGVAWASLFCGWADTATRAELADLRQRLDAEQRRTAAAEHKLDELENRVFLLTDQVESQKVASLHRAPRPLPVVTLKPDAEAAPPADDEIVFAGAA